MNKYFVKDRVKGDIEFTIEAENISKKSIQKYLLIMIVSKLKKYSALIS